MIAENPETFEELLLSGGVTWIVLADFEKMPESAHH